MRVSALEITRAGLKGRVVRISRKLIVKYGLKLKKTRGDAKHPDLLRKNHWEIRRGKGMNKNRFKKALKELSKAIKGEPSR